MDEHAMNSLTRDFGRTYLKNSILFYEGERGEEVFFLTSGSVRITTTSTQAAEPQYGETSGQVYELAVLKAGDIFGEMAVLDERPRSATATAIEDSEVFVFNKADFFINLERYPLLAVRFLKLLASRIRRMDEQFKKAIADH